MINMKNIKIDKKRGFTLIEIMVAMSIFMIVMLMAIGALFVTSNSAKKAKALRTAMDNVNFAMENMSRNLRMGSNFNCTSTPVSSSSLNNSMTNDCSSGNHAIIFTPYEYSQGNLAFQLSSSSGSSKTVQKVSSTGTIDLTSPEVNITDLKFFVSGSGLGDNPQPSVFIMMKGEIIIKNEKTNFAIQTLASQRNAEQ